MARSFSSISTVSCDMNLYSVHMELHSLLLQGASSLLASTSEAHWLASPNSCMSHCLIITPLCHDSFILVDSHLTFAHYFPSLHSLRSQDGYLVVCINSQVHPPSLPAISIPHLHRYHYWKPLQPLSNIPVTLETCLQGRVRFHDTLTTSDAGSDI